jgi:hypothetical protein
MENNEISKKLDPRYRTFFIKDEKLLHEENEMIEYKNYQTFPILDDILIEALKKVICGFLNQKGGRLYIGVNDDKEVMGLYLTDKNQDVSKNFIQNLTAHFYPKCRTEKIGIHLVPIKDDCGDYITNLFVVKVIVRQGDTNKLYSMTDKLYHSTIRLNGLVQTLYCEEIVKEIFKRTYSPKEALPESEFNDPEPIKPIYTNKELILSQDNYYLKHKDENNFRSSNVNPFMPQQATRKLREVIEKENKSLTRIRVTNLDSSATLADLSEIFKQYELYHNNPIHIEHATLNNEVMCIAYVNFENFAEAIKAKSELQFITFKDRALNIKII